MVLVSQGSLRPDVTELRRPAVQGLAEEDVLVVVTTGAADPTALESVLDVRLPANVRCTRFVPYDVLLPHAAAFVTNGGYSGVTPALAHGVPLLQAGVTEEKAEIGARIHWTGVGVRLGTTRPEPAAVRSGVRRVLGPDLPGGGQPGPAGDGRSRRRARGRCAAPALGRDPAAGVLRRPSRALTGQVGGTGSVTWAQRSMSPGGRVRRRSTYQTTPPTAAPMATIIFHCTTPP
ncbi:hypothetical protein GCM10009616_11810 [Microlunatus lacustris]